VGAESGGASPSLKEWLFSHGCEFDFFQAVRLLRRIAPARRPVGKAERPSSEVVRFGAQLTLSFPPSSVHEVIEKEGQPPRMTVAFFGLTGTQGVLPHAYTEYLIARRAVNDETLAAFLDLFNHRLISFFYRAWEKHQPAVEYEHAVGKAEEPERFAQYLFDLIGMGTGGLRSRLRIRDQSLLFYGGLLAQRPHSASALRGILRDYFRVAVEIEQCRGDWYPLRATDRSYMVQEGLHNQLGGGAIAGDQVWDQQARFRLRLGPLSLDRFLAFLPGGRALTELVEWARFFAGPAYAFEVNLILKASDVPYCRLTDSGPEAPRLGWLGWLKTEEFQAEARDVEFAYMS